MALHLIRHGETAENARRVLQLPDAPLSEPGLAQARALAARLAAAGIRRILSSDFCRAQMTAEAIAATTSAGIELEPLLQERNFGALRGRAYADLDFDPFAPGYEPPEGESERAFLERATRAFERVAAFARAAEGPFAVVTHGLVCRAFVEHHMQRESDAPLPGHWANTALTLADPAPPWRVRLVACTVHLDEAAREGGAA